MKIYLAGNFPQLIVKGEEKRVCKLVHKLGGRHNRLISFYYSKISMSVLNLKIKKRKKIKL